MLHMTRTLFVAGALAVLLIALWMQDNVGGAQHRMAAVSLPASTAAPLPSPAADLAARAVEDLAAWPITATR